MARRFPDLVATAATMAAAALVATGAAFAQKAPEGNRVEINGMPLLRTPR